MLQKGTNVSPCTAPVAFGGPLDARALRLRKAPAHWAPLRVPSPELSPGSDCPYVTFAVYWRAAGAEPLFPCTCLLVFCRLKGKVATQVIIVLLGYANKIFHVLIWISWSEIQEQIHSGLLCLLKVWKSTNKGKRAGEGGNLAAVLSSTWVHEQNCFGQDLSVNPVTLSSSLALSPCLCPSRPPPKSCD